MSITFTADRYLRVRENYSKYFNHKAENIITGVVVASRDPGRPEPKTPYLTQQNCNNLEISPEEIIDTMDYHLSRFEYYGDAFPMINFDAFGPGVVSAFLGATLDNSTGRVWFHPKGISEIETINLQFDPDNIWFKRIKSIYKAGLERWEGKVLLGMPDLGGVIDILSTFRPSEELLFDLYDNPNEVKRLTSQITALWHRYYEELSNVLMPVNPGYTDWSTIYSDTPSYITQCDFSYMISPEMFNEFAYSELEYSSSRLSRTTYHLDGIGELNHLDSILKIKNLDGVQWIPGEGSAPYSEWPDVYKKIQAAGKLIQVGWSSFEELEVISKQVGNDGIIQTPPKYFEEKDKDYAMSWLNKLGIEK